MVQKHIWNFRKNEVEQGFFETTKTFIHRVDGWMVEESKGSFFFFKFKHDNKQDVLVLNMLFEVVTAIR